MILIAPVLPSPRRFRYPRHFDLRHKPCRADEAKSGKSRDIRTGKRGRHRQPDRRRFQVRLVTQVSERANELHVFAWRRTDDGIILQRFEERVHLAFNHNRVGEASGDDFKAQV